MIEKVNCSHPDKVADRIAGAIVDLAYKKEENPKVAIEVLIGHSTCNVIIESSVYFGEEEIQPIVDRIGGVGIDLNLIYSPQDKHLADNQKGKIRCGDNGIFKGVPLTKEEKELSSIAHYIYEHYPYDGKYILDNHKLIICQSNAKEEDLRKDFEGAIINPLGYWTGGTNVDTGATNRKLGSDMAQSVTGGGLHGKSFCKADVSVNIYCFLLAQELNKTVECCCAIGDEQVFINGEWIDYEEIVDTAKEYIKNIGGFEKFAEWGLF